MNKKASMLILVSISLVLTLAIAAFGQNEVDPTSGIIITTEEIIGESGNENTELNYEVPETYANEDFYQNSDHTQWDWRYVQWESREFQNRLRSDPDARTNYLRNHLQCQSCSFDQGNQEITYTFEGIVHPRSGLFRDPWAMPQETRLIATAERIEAMLPGGTGVALDEQVDFGSVTIIAGTDSLVTSQDQTGAHIQMRGAITLREGKALVAKTDAATIEKYPSNPAERADILDVIASTNDVDISLKTQCQTNCVTVDKNRLYAKGSGFKIRIKSSSILSFDSLPPEHQDKNDALEFRIGDLGGRQGEIEVSTVRNGMPIVETSGVVYGANDNIGFRIVGNTFHLLTTKLSDADSGSVPLTLNPGKGNQYYQFDNSQNLYVDAQRAYANQVIMRQFLQDTYGFSLNGYFSSAELGTFDRNAKKLENFYGIELKQAKKDGKPLQIIDSDRRFLESGVGGSYSKEFNDMSWDVGDRNIFPSTRIVYGGAIGGSGREFHESKRIFTHEIHHLFYGLDPSYSSRINSKLNELGFRVVSKHEGGFSDWYVERESITLANINFFTPGLIYEDTVESPSVEEVQAYFSEELIHNPSFLTDPSVSAEIRKMRQDFASAFVVEKFRR